MKTLREVTHSTVTWKIGGGDDEMARVSKSTGIEPAKLRQMAHNFRNTKINWDTYMKKDKPVPFTGGPKHIKTKKY